MTKKVNPSFGKFNPQPSVNAFRLEEGGFMFYGWETESKEFNDLDKLCEHIKKYFKEEGECDGI